MTIAISRLQLLVLVCFSATGLGLASTGAHAQDDWRVVPIETSEDILSMATFNNRTWAVGTNKLLARAQFTNPLEWFVESTPGGEHYLSITTTEDGDYVIFGGTNGICKYVDENHTHYTWTLPDTDVAFRFGSHFFSDAHAVGSDGSIYYADTPGDPWERQYARDTQLNDVNSLVAVGNEGRILVDDGTWSWVESGTNLNLYSVTSYLQGPNPGQLIAGEGGLILKLYQGVVTPRNSGTTSTLYDLVELPFNTGVLAVGENGTVLMSEDQGESWCAFDTGSTETLYAGTASGTFDWFVGGANGTLLYSTTQGGACVPVANEAPAPDRGFSLSQPWPNPTIQQTSFTLAVERTQHVTVDVHDVLGRRVQSVFAGIFTAGISHTMTIERKNLPAGTYFVRVRGESFTDSRRVSIIQ